MTQIPDPEGKALLAQTPVAETPVAEVALAEVAVVEEAAESEEAAETTPPSTRGQGRRRLLSSMTPRATRGQLLAGLLCMLLGFAVVVQVQQNQSSTITSLRQSDLIRILGNLTQRSDRLEAQARTLQAQRDQLQTGTDHGAVAEQAAQQRLTLLTVLAGTVPVRGPGIRLEIADPNVAITATSLLDAVEELRDGGAEAIQTGDVRVTLDTFFTDRPGGGILANKTVLTPPYTVLAIGDSQGLSTALKIPGGVVEALQAKGATVTVTEVETVTIDALHQLTSPLYARPAPAASP
jgi:uncharacterized protein YlxW (UPF0749 family)